MLNNQKALGVVSSIILLVITLIALALGVPVNILSTIGNIIVVMIIIIIAMICAAGGVHAGIAFLVFFAFQTIRITVSRLTRPEAGEVASEYYKFISSDWLNFVLVGLMLGSGVWLLISLLFSKTSLPVKLKSIDEISNSGEQADA